MRLRAAATAAAVLLGLLWVPAPAAHASVNVADDLHAEYDGCIAKFTAAGLRDLVDQLDRSKHEFEIERSSGTIANPDSRSNAANGKGTGGTLKWNPDDTSPFSGDGVPNDRCATLYHEMSHLADYDKGDNRRDPCIYLKDGKPVDTGVPVNEVRATRKENVYRSKQNPPLPQRTHYGKGKPLPPDGTECQPKPPEPPSRGCSAGCAIGAGDPHLKTFDEVHYDFQAVGEFVLTRATAGDPLEIQGRTSALGGLRTVSLFSAVVANVNGDRVGLYRDHHRLAVHIGGSRQDLPSGTRNLPKGGTVTGYTSSLAEMQWPDGSAVRVQAVGTASVRLSVHLADARRSKVEGLFGNFDGNKAADLVVRGGGPIGEKPSFETLYRTFGDSWRVAQAQSLFDYGPGQSTETFTDRTFPDRPVTAADLPNRATAEAICRRAGVVEPRTLEACILDVGLTGEAAYAADAIVTQQLVETAGATLLSVTQPGGEARMTFRGTAGQNVFIDVPAATVPDQCSPLQLVDPAGKVLRTGCVISGRGYVDATVLPADGEYTVALKPSRGTGKASVRVVTAVDQELTVTPGGPAVATIIGQPGAVTRLRFTGTKGQKVFLNLPASTLPDECSPLRLLDAAGKVLNSGCVINGDGYIDATVLPADGQYTVLIDPDRERTGFSQVRLLTAIDQTGTIALDGPAVTATVSQPGATVRLTFAGRAGQRVALNASTSTLPDQCSPLRLLDPAGKVLDTGCVISGKGEIRGSVLPADGQYTIEVDPDRDYTGTAQLRLRSG